MVERLMLRGVLSPQFVAAVLAVDMEEPVLSSARARILAFVPDTIKFRAIPPGQPPDFAAMRAAHAESTTVQAVIKAVETSNPSPGSPEADFLAVLKSPNPIDVLAQRVEAYLERVESDLAGPKKQNEIDRLFRRLVERRIRVLQSERFGPLDETSDRLLPVPPFQRPIKGPEAKRGLAGRWVIRQFVLGISRHHVVSRLQVFCATTARLAMCALPSPLDTESEERPPRMRRQPMERCLCRSCPCHAVGRSASPRSRGCRS
jgi:hypothetical protein